MTMMIMVKKITDFRIALRIRDQGVITKMIMMMIRAKWWKKPVARKKYGRGGAGS